jgi:copper chaperone CopZ
MKKIVLFISIVFIAMQGEAQFSKASLQASGLTCAMCSNAINKALAVLPFVSEVKPDIKNSIFNITFKDNEAFSIDALQAAVEGAGFSVAKLQLTGQFNNIPIKNDQHTKIDGQVFHFVDVNDQQLSGEKTITIVDKKYVTNKDFKKFSNKTTMECFQTGLASSCCKIDGIVANTRIFHVTL